MLDVQNYSNWPQLVSSQLTWTNKSGHKKAPKEALHTQSVTPLRRSQCPGNTAPPLAILGHPTPNPEIVPANAALVTCL